MSITLHTHPFSSNGQKAQLMLDVLGLDYTTLEVPFEVERIEWFASARDFANPIHAA